MMPQSKSSRKIGVISDTHRKVEYAKAAIEYLQEQGVEFFIHAGDVVEEEILALLEATQIPYVAVYGNNDAHLRSLHHNYNLVKEPHYFKLAQTSFKLMHLPFYMTPDTEIVIFGHTHLFECDYKNDTLFLNPGEVCARNKPVSEFALLEIDETLLKVTHIYRETSAKNYKTKLYSFEREHYESKE